MTWTARSVWGGTSSHGGAPCTAIRPYGSTPEPPRDGEGRTVRDKGPVATTAAAGLAAERVADRRADLAHGVVADLPDRPGECLLSDCVDAVAVDDRWSVEPDLRVIDVDLSRKATNRRGDLGDRDQIAHVDDLRPCHDNDRSLLAAHPSQPQLPSPHSSPHASASVQNASGRSGCRRYASRSDRANAACTASATP